MTALLRILTFRPRFSHALALILAGGLLAACAGDPDSVKADFDRGLSAYDGGDYATAFHLWDGIKNDDLAAMRNVAVMLRTGQGAPKNPAKARALFAEAADAGLSSAAYNLGQMLIAGEGGKRDVKSGLSWMERAAPTQPLAAAELGEIYRKGKLVPVDLIKARTYLAMAAAAGDTQSAQILAQLPTR